MARRKISPALKAKAVAACKASIKATGKPEFAKNAKATGVTEPSLRIWWAKENGPVRKSGKKAAAPKAAPVVKAKRGRKPKAAAVVEAKVAVKGKKRGRPAGRPATVKAAPAKAVSVKAAPVKVASIADSGLESSIKKLELQLGAIVRFLERLSGN